MTTIRYFVAVDANGDPLTQRSSARPYQSASNGGYSFSIKPVSAKSPLRVVEVSRPLEWRAIATLPDGSIERTKSQAGDPGRNFVRFSYKAKQETKWTQATKWSNANEEEIRADFAKPSPYMEHRLDLFAAGSVELHHWPHPLFKPHWNQSGKASTETEARS